MKLKQRIFFAVVALLMTIGVQGQQREYIDLDLNLIKVNVSMNPEHYKELMDRYLAADTTLRIDELATVYYGYAATMDYAPDLTYPEIDAAIEAEDYASAYNLSVEKVKESPVSLRLLTNIVTFVPHIDLKNRIAEFMNLRTRLSMLIGTILSTGTGIVSSSPIQVISEDDMMVLLKDFFEVDKIVDRTNIGNVDAVKITFSTSAREHILYFDKSLQDQYIQ